MSKKDDAIADPLKKYSPEMKEKLVNHSSVINAINNMRDRGYTKEATQRIVGVPYEVVDRIYNLKNPLRVVKKEPTEEDT